MATAGRPIVRGFFPEVSVLHETKAEWPRETLFGALLNSVVPKALIAHAKCGGSVFVK